MRYQLAIFDFDGTLADSYPWFASRYNAVAERFGCRRLDADELERMRGLHSRQFLAQVGLPLWRLPALLKHVRRAIAEDASGIRLFAGMAGTLSELHAAGLRMAVVSSNSEEVVRKVLGEELAGRFSHFACGGSLFGKAAHFRRTIRRLQVEPARALCIGDELRDVDAAREAGLDFAAVAWGYTRAESLAPHAKYLFASPADIAAAFA